MISSSAKLVHPDVLRFKLAEGILSLIKSLLLDPLKIFPNIFKSVNVLYKL